MSDAPSHPFPDGSFTPGPWAVGEGGNGLDVVAGRGINVEHIATVASSRRLQKGQARHDARLIAAAPDMHRVLWAALSAANELGLSSSVFPREEIKAALSKATGGQHV